MKSFSSAAVAFFSIGALALSGAACSSDEKSAPPGAPQAPAAVAKTEPPAAPPAAEKAAPAAPKPAMAISPDGPGPGDEPGLLTAFVDADESIGDVPLTVQLNVDIIDNTGNPPFTFIWDFGDATEFSTDKAPKHVYKVPGSFRASVIVTDSKGEKDQDYVDISVNEPLPEGAITAEQLMEIIPPGEVAPELKGMEDQIKSK
jgi:hypothetical protein